jgi:hypothetical protein
MNQGYVGRRPDDRPRQQGNPPDFTTMTEYRDANGHLKREVFVDWPKRIAGSLGDTRTSLRRAYDRVAALHFRLRMGEDPQAVLKPGLGELHRFVEYQCGRGVIKQDTKRFIQVHCDAVGHDPKKFEGFYQLFQSVIAYLGR